MVGCKVARSARKHTKYLKKRALISKQKGKSTFMILLQVRVKAENMLFRNWSALVVRPTDNIVKDQDSTLTMQCHTVLTISDEITIYQSMEIYISLLCCI